MRRVLFILAIILTFFGASKALAGESSLLATMLPNPLDVVLQAPSNVLLNQTFEVKAEVKNQGPSSVSNASATLSLPTGLVFAKGSKPTVGLGKIPKQSFKQASWKVTSTAPGDYILLASAQASLNGQIIEASDTVMLNVSPTPFSRRGGFLRTFFISFAQAFGQ